MRKKRAILKNGLFRKPYDGEVINVNDMINLTYLPSKSCYASKLTDDVAVKLKYIQARVREGHESVIEHGFICMLITIKKDKADEFVQVTNGFRYLNVETSMDGNYIYILIGGGIRGFKHLIRETLHQANTIIYMVKECLYECSYRAFFVDLINGGAMKDNFIDPVEDASNHIVISCNSISTTMPDRVEILNIDPIQSIYNAVKKYGFTMEQCLSMASITILFKNMSRIITQQLTRHRNAITQESQRYVDYSDAAFNSPAIFKPEKYADKSYGVDLFSHYGTKIHLGSYNMQQLGEQLCSIYSQLIEQGVEKEDARGFLPQNNQSSKVFMTFTYRSLIQFLKLRTDSHAQAEIRMYANVIDEAFRKYLEDNVPDFNEDIYYYTIPRYLKTEDEEYHTTIAVDEVLDEQVVEATAEELEVPVNEKENAELFKSEMEGYNPAKYAATREDDKAIKEATSGKKDI